VLANKLNNDEITKKDYFARMVKARVSVDRHPGKEPRQYHLRNSGFCHRSEFEVVISKVIVCIYYIERMPRDCSHDRQFLNRAKSFFLANVESYSPPPTPRLRRAGPGSNELTSDSPT